LGVQGLPALASPGEGGQRLVVGWLVPLWLLTLWFTGYTLTCVAQLLGKQERKRTLQTVSSGTATDTAHPAFVLAYSRCSGGAGMNGLTVVYGQQYVLHKGAQLAPATLFLVFLLSLLFSHRLVCNSLQVLSACCESTVDVSLAGLMLAAAVLLTVYCARFSAVTQPQANYSVYDAISQSPARIFLPAKAYSQDTVDTAVSAAVSNTSSAHGSSSCYLDNGQQPLQPGVAGRWLLPDADGDFDALAGLMAGVGSMAQLWVAYSLLQGIVLILLVLR
jgi:hypothetical protein